MEELTPEGLEHLRRTLKNASAAARRIYDAKTGRGEPVGASAELRYLKSIESTLSSWLDLIGWPISRTITDLVQNGNNMADGKYGRIFTQDDVCEIVRFMRPDGFDAGSVEAAIEELDSDGSATFPPEEPIFTLRAKDRCALGTVRYYGDLIVRSPEEHKDSVERAVRTFEQFRADHGDRMKDPD